jgi:hypothetical protein
VRGDCRGLKENLRWEENLGAFETESWTVSADVSI